MVASRNRRRRRWRLRWPGRWRALLVVRLSPQDREPTIDLLEQDDPRQAVGQGDPPERDESGRPLPHLVGQTLGAPDHDYIQSTVFTRNWGERLRELLTPEDWKQRSALCDAGSPKNILKSPDYFCVYPITVFAARIPS